MVKFEDRYNKKEMLPATCKWRLAVKNEMLPATCKMLAGNLKRKKSD
jgi:hypothetical protein